jgi:hypothetical protein
MSTQSDRVLAPIHHALILHPWGGHQVKTETVVRIVQTKIAQRRMTTLAIISTLDIGKNSVFSLLPGAIMLAVDQF